MYTVVHEPQMNQELHPIHQQSVHDSSTQKKSIFSTMLLEPLEGQNPWAATAVLDAWASSTEQEQLETQACLVQEPRMNQLHQIRQQSVLPHKKHF